MSIFFLIILGLTCIENFFLIAIIVEGSHRELPALQIVRSASLKVCFILDVSVHLFEPSLSSESSYYYSSN